jgi:outer membrane protein assembly factor BamB
MNPAIDDNYVYFGNMKRMLYCLDKRNGKIIWEKETKGYFNSTPIVTKNHLIVPNSFKSIMIYNKIDGTLVNEIELDNRAKLSPVIIRNKLLIGYDEGIIAAYEFVE